MTRRRARATVRGTVCWYNETNEQKVDAVENKNTEDDLLRGFWDLFLGVLRLGSGQTGQFGTGIGKGCSDKNTAEAMESVEESRVGCVPKSNQLVPLFNTFEKHSTNQYVPPI